MADEELVPRSEVHLVVNQLLNDLEMWKRGHRAVEIRDETNRQIAVAEIEAELNEARL
jgi:hypothetical protein